MLPPPPAEHTETDADAVEEIDENAYFKDAGFLRDADLVVQSVYNALPEVFVVEEPLDFDESEITAANP